MTDLFRTRDHVPNFDNYVAQFVARSAATRSALRGQLDVAYGQGADERLDLFFPEQLQHRAPVHLFVHGGYWRMFAKSDYSFVADTVTRAGAIAAVMDYSLLPAVRSHVIVDQVIRAIQWLTAYAERFGGDAGSLTVSGHSAGAHLCAMLLDRDSPVRPRGGLLLSGVYEIGPLRQSFLQPQIGLTDEEVERFSPLRLDLAPSDNVRLLVGDQETEPFHAQARQLARRLRTAAERIVGNHMSVVLDLGNPETEAGQALRATCC